MHQYPALTNQVENRCCLCRGRSAEAIFALIRVSYTYIKQTVSIALHIQQPVKDLIFITSRAGLVILFVEVDLF